MWLWLACVAPEPVSTEDVDSATGTVSTSPEDSPPVDSTPPRDPPPEEEGIGDASLDDSWIFSLESLHTVDLTIDDAGVAALALDPYASVRADVAYDGVEMPSIGVRLRGKIGSFRPLTGKPKFALDFNKFVENQRFYGLESLSLNNSVVDCSFLKDSLGYYVFGLAGVPTLRTAYAQVTVNGAAYGLYIVLETPDDRYLERTFPEPGGNLYDGKYIWYGGGSYTLLDFTPDVQDLYQLEEGVDVGHEDIHAIVDALAASAGTPDLYATVGTILNWDEYLMELAVEQWVGHNDGYALNTNNYRVYFNPADGRAWILPWDLDYGFLNDYDWGMSWAYPRGQLASRCFTDATCRAAELAMVDRMLNTIDPLAVRAYLEKIDALTYDAAVADPRKECSVDGIVPGRDYLRTWIDNRPGQLRAFWGL